MTTPSNPYAGLIERLLERDANWQENCARWEAAAEEYGQPMSDEQKALVRHNLHAEAAEALSRLTRDVEEAKEVLTSLYGLHPGLRERVDATLTRLSRPIELGADPAFVASQSSPSVSTKGFNRGERKEAE